MEHVNNHFNLSDPINGNQICPVCLSETNFAVRTNCGHLFCAQCLLTYYHLRHGSDAMTCPLCRRQVVLLMAEFSPAERTRESNEKRQLLQQISDYNGRFANHSVPWLQTLHDLPTLLSRCMVDLFSLNGLMWTFRCRIVVCLLLVLIYFLLPIDLVPEILFGILGLFDDVFFALLIALRISSEFRRQMASRQPASDSR